MAAYTQYNLKSLHRIQDLRDEFDKMPADAVADCLRRPSIAKPREISLKFKLRPSIGDADNVKVEHELTSKTPNQPLATYTCTTSVSGELRFQPAFPDDPHQQDLLDGGEE